MEKSPSLPPVGIFTGGGTGGHVFPGVAVWRKVSEWWPGKLLWVGSTGGMEEKLIKSQGLPFKGIAAGKLRRYVSFRNITDVFKILFGFLTVLLFFLRIKPKFVFSKGGFVSVPPVWAAGLLGIPVFSHESDLYSGLATRLNLFWSKRLYVGYEKTRLSLPLHVRKRVLTTGNPVRHEIMAGSRTKAEERWGLSPETTLILVLGGSSGALQINELIPILSRHLVKRATILHQTGRSWHPPTLTNYTATPFLGPEIADALARADLLISRAGAGSLWEAAVWKLPMVLIPLEAGSRGDQVHNALFWQDLGCAKVLLHPTAQRLVDTVEALIDDPQQLLEMRKSFPDMARSAAEIISHDLRSFLDYQVQTPYL